MDGLLRLRHSQTAILILVVAGLGLLYRATARPLRLVVDGKERTVLTHARRVADLLHEAGYEPATEDRVAPEAGAPLLWKGQTVPLIELDRARPVAIQAGEADRILVSPELAPGNLLSLAGETLFPGDQVWVNGLPLLGGGIQEQPERIELRSAVPIRFEEQGIAYTLFSAAPTLGQALWEGGVELFEGDQLSPPAETEVDGPTTARLLRSRPMQVNVGDTVIGGRTAAQSVEQGLSDLGIPLIGLDYSLPGPNEAMPADGQVRVVRVIEQLQIDQVPLPFETVYQPLDALEIDQKQVQQPGAYGVSAERTRVRFEDGQEVVRVIEDQWVAKEPIDQIVGYGTNIVIRSVVTADGSLEYWRAVQMYATSYSPSRAGIPLDHPWFGITASGRPLTKGLVAIDRSLISFGTRMYVPGYGFAEAADTGGGVRGRWIDLGYDDDNYVPWHQYVTVYFLTPLPPLNSIVYIFP